MTDFNISEGFAIKEEQTTPVCVEAPPNVVVILKTYSGENTQRYFREDVAELAAKGFVPSTQHFVPGNYGCGLFLLGVILSPAVIGVVILTYMLLVKPEGTLYVTFENRSGNLPLKACPQCAEHIRMTARVCHFCKHTFENSNTSRT